jgi:signal transduction histidine kinase
MPQQPGQWVDFNPDDGWEDFDPFSEDEQETDYWKSLKAGVLEGVPRLDTLGAVSKIADEPDAAIDLPTGLGNIKLPTSLHRIADVLRYPAGAFDEVYNAIVPPLTNLPNMLVAGTAAVAPATIPIAGVVFGSQMATEMPRQARDVMANAGEKGWTDPETIGKMGQLGLTGLMTAGAVHGGAAYKGRKVILPEEAASRIPPAIVSEGAELPPAEPVAPVNASMLPLPEGYIKEVGKTSSKEGHTFNAEVDWKNKRIVFKDEEALNSVDVHNHEVAHIMYESLPDDAKQKFTDSYLQQKQNKGDYAKYGLDWMIKNNFHREDIAIDLGNYFTHPERVDPGVKGLFDLWFAGKKKELTTRAAAPKLEAPPVRKAPDIVVSAASLDARRIADLRLQGFELIPIEDGRAFKLVKPEVDPNAVQKMGRSTDNPFYNDWARALQEAEQYGIDTSGYNREGSYDRAGMMELIELEELIKLERERRGIFDEPVVEEAPQELVDRLERIVAEERAGSNLTAEDIELPLNIRQNLAHIEEVMRRLEEKTLTEETSTRIQAALEAEVLDLFPDNPAAGQKILSEIKTRRAAPYGAEAKDAFSQDYASVMAKATELGIDIRDYSTVFELSEAVILEEARQTLGIPFTRVDEALMALEQARSREIMQMARTAEGGIKLGFDESLGDTLGSNLYKGKAAPTIIREAVQNAKDAAEKTGGEVHVVITDDGKIIVRDTGIGMTREQIDTVYTDLGGSGKRDEADASGGFGVAKAAFLLARGTKQKTVTVALDPITGQKKRITFESTPEQIKKGLPPEAIKEEIVSPETPTGTTLEVKLTELGPWELDTARNVLRNISDYSELTVPLYRDSYGIYQKASLKAPLSERKTKNFVNIKNFENDSATATINHSPIKPEEKHRFVTVHVLNNGLYQFTMSKNLGVPIKGVPETVVVNIKPKVRETHPDYPFTMNREEIRGSMETEISRFIDEELIKPQLEKAKNYTQELYDGMEEIREIGKPVIHVYDAGGRFTPQEMEIIKNSPTLRKVGDLMWAHLTTILDAIKEPAIKRRIEKIGFVFDEKSRALHIPNPSTTDTSAILINPFELLLAKDNTTLTPSEASAAYLMANAHESLHSRGIGDVDQNFGIVIADLYTALAKGDRDVAIRRAFRDAVTDPFTGTYNTEVQGLLQTYLDSRRREPTKDDALTRTGTKLPNQRSNPEGAIPGDGGPNGMGASANVVTILRQALERSRELESAQRDIYRGERAAKFAKARRAKGEGQEWFANFKSKLRGEHTKVSQEPPLLGQAEVDGLFNMIRDSSADVPDRIHAGTGLTKILNGDVPQLNEIKVLGQIFGDDMSDLFSAYHGMAGPEVLPKVDVKKKNIIAESVNLPRSLQSSMDLSAPLRQGIGLIHTKAWWTNWGIMIKSRGSEKIFRQSQEAILARPNFQQVMGPTGRVGKSLAQRAGLKLTDLTDLGKREESMQSTWAEKVPGVRGSNRAYIAFLNNLRADVFDSLIRDAERAGLEPRFNDVLLKEIGSYINNATGRGSLGNFERTAVGLNGLFFSPRLIASRLQMMNPRNYLFTNKFVRKQYLKSLLGLAGAWATFAGLAKFAGAEVSMNPTSADFGKIKVGNTRLDPAGGFQQYLVLMARLATGKFTSSTTGQSYQMGQKFGGNTRYDTLVNFFTNKLAPVPHTAATMMSASRYQPFMVGDNLIRMFTPMIIQDISELAQEDPRLLPFAIPAGFGMGVQEYQRGGKEHRFLPEEVFPSDMDWTIPENAR